MHSNSYLHTDVMPSIDTGIQHIGNQYTPYIGLEMGQDSLTLFLPSCSDKVDASLSLLGVRNRLEQAIRQLVDA